jgi:hypothetical protein
MARLKAAQRATGSVNAPSAKPPALLEAAALGLSKRQLAETIGLGPEALYKRQRANATKTRARLQEMLEILTRVAGWAGGAA